MALLDFITNRNAAPQPSVAANTQAQAPPQPTVESLPASVRAQAVEAARPAAALMDQATTPRTAPAQSQPAPNAIARGRSLSMGR